jgi:hypothetical protein
MHIAIMSQKMKWFDGKKLIWIPVVQGSILTNDMGCDMGCGQWPVRLGKLNFYSCLHNDTSHQLISWNYE